jgi:hypothetical protein
MRRESVTRISSLLDSQCPVPWPSRSFRSIWITFSRLDTLSRWFLIAHSLPDVAPRCQQSLPAVIGPWPLGLTVNHSGGYQAATMIRLPTRRRPSRLHPSFPPLDPGAHPPVYHAPDGSFPVGPESGLLFQPHLYKNVKSNAVWQRRPHDNPWMTPEFRVRREPSSSQVHPTGSVVTGFSALTESRSGSTGIIFGDGVCDSEPARPRRGRGFGG